MTEGRCRKTENRGRMAEDWGQRRLNAEFGTGEVHGAQRIGIETEDR